MSTTDGASPADDGAYNVSTSPAMDIGLRRMPATRELSALSANATEASGPWPTRPRDQVAG